MEKQKRVDAVNRVLVVANVLAAVWGFTHGHESYALINLVIAGVLALSTWRLR